MDPNPQDFELEIIGDIDQINPTDDNVDIFVTLSDGSEYVATFFTFTNLRTLLDLYALSGECNNGSYFWASDMILVHKITLDTLRQTVLDLIQENSFFQAFSKVETEDDVSSDSNT